MKKFRFVIAGLILQLSAGGFAASGIFAQTVTDDQKAVGAYFVSADWLKANLDKAVVIDVREKSAYTKGHIPGAVNKRWQELSNFRVKQSEPGWAIILPQDELAKIFGDMGIDGTKPIVVYNEPLVGWGEEGRILWILRVFGLTNSFILNGGLQAWQSSGGAISRQDVVPKAVTLKAPARDDSLFASTAYVAANLGKINILDAREKAEYDGKKNYGEVQRGRIPGAMHFFYMGLYNADGTIKSPTELRAIFTKLGFSPDKEIVSYCTAGIRSALATIALRTAGFTKAKNYDGSFSEWTATGQTIEK